MQPRSLQRWVEFGPEEEGVFYLLPCEKMREVAAAEGQGGKHQVGVRDYLLWLYDVPDSLRGAWPPQPAPCGALFRSLVAARADLLVALA